jgi:hypothetical protein
MSILFESNTNEPTEFEYNGEIMVNQGDVKILDKLPWEDDE